MNHGLPNQTTHRRGFFADRTRIIAVRIFMICKRERHVAEKHQNKLVPAQCIQIRDNALESISGSTLTQK